MKIGSGWTKNNNDGDTFISIALDETVLELYPQLKNCNISLGWIKDEDRKKENSPAWSVNLSVKKQKKDDKEAVKNAEEKIINSAQQTNVAEDFTPTEEIPY